MVRQSYIDKLGEIRRLDNAEGNCQHAVINGLGRLYKTQIWLEIAFCPQEIN
jgi:hypothetical protein